MENSDEPEILTGTQVAEIFGVKRETVSRWARNGKLSHIRTVGGHRRYRREDIENILKGITE